MGWLTWALTANTGWLIWLLAIAWSRCGIRQEKRVPRSKASLIGFALLSLVLSLTAGPGIELLLNQPALARERARELIEQQVLDTQRLQERQMRPRSRRRRPLRLSARTSARKYEELPAGDLRRDELYVRANGIWSDRNRDWSKVPTADLPVCRRTDHPSV